MNFIIYNNDHLTKIKLFQAMDIFFYSLFRGVVVHPLKIRQPRLTNECS